MLHSKNLGISSPWLGYLLTIIEQILSRSIEPVAELLDIKTSNHPSSFQLSGETDILLRLTSTKSYTSFAMTIVTPAVAFQEKPSEIFHDEEIKKPAEKVDYSGAHEKTDPKEIALVKKLDRWIMPMLWSMYWLNYLDRNAIALARLNDLEDDLGLSSTRKSICTEFL